MDADHFLVLGPYRHHRDHVGLLDRLVEGGLGFLGAVELHTALAGTMWCRALEDPLRLEVAHAFEVAQRALAREAGAAGQVQLHDLGARRQRRGEGRAARSVQREHGTVERRGNVHQSRVVRHHHLRGRQQVDGLLQAGGPAQVAAAPAAQLLDLRADGAVLRRADQPDLPAALGRAARRGGEVLGGPALGRPVLRARTQTGHRRLGAQPQAREQRIARWHRDASGTVAAAGAAAARLSASARWAKRSAISGSASASSRRASLSRIWRASPTKPVRSPIPARRGISADLNEFGSTMA